MLGDEVGRVTAQNSTAAPQSAGPPATEGLSGRASNRCSTIDGPPPGRGHVRADLEFLGDHQFSSMTQAGGYWCCGGNRP